MTSEQAFLKVQAAGRKIGLTDYESSLVFYGGWSLMKRVTGRAPDPIGDGKDTMTGLTGLMVRAEMLAP